MTNERLGEIIKELVAFINSTKYPYLTLSQVEGALEKEFDRARLSPTAPLHQPGEQGGLK